MSPARLTAAVAAIVAWGALALQLVLIVRTMTGDGATVGEAVWRFFGFFTVLTCTLVGAVASAMALRPQSALASAPVRLATAASIGLVGLVYSLALRALWSPTGLDAVADHALHDVTPVMFLLAWLVGRHEGMSWRTALWAMPWPLAYVVYALVRGAADGWYAYWFLNPSKLAPIQLAMCVAVLAAAMVAIALLLVAIDRRLSRRRAAAA